MQNDQYLTQKRDEIIGQVRQKFKPTPKKLNEFIVDTNFIMASWEDDLFVKRSDALLSEYSKFLSEHTRAYDMLYEPSSVANTINSSGESFLESERFYWAAWIKFDQCIINLLKDPDTIKSTPKAFSEYLLHKKNTALAILIKEKFSVERGKRIRLLLEALKRTTPPLLSYENRQKMEIYNAMRVFFERDIATYQAIFNATRLDNLENNPDFIATKEKLNFIIESINNDNQ